jgi:phage tail-like protein
LTDRATADGATPDPVGGHGFRVKVDDAVIGKFSECSGLEVEYEILEYQEGGENRFTHKLRSRVKYPNLVLKRGVTHEDALLKWLFESKEMAKRGAVTVELIGSDAKSVRSWAFAGALPVKWTGPSLNAGSSSVATESLEITHQGLVMKG